MNMKVINEQMQVGVIRIIAVTTSSIVLVGDTEAVALSSVFDTPPESYVIGPLVPLAAGGAAR